MNPRSVENNEGAQVLVAQNIGGGTCPCAPLVPTPLTPDLKLLKLLDGLSKGSLLIEDQIIGEYIQYAHLPKQLMILVTKFEGSTVVNFASSFENAK